MDPSLNIEFKKGKARLYAIVLTLLIAILYLVFSKDELYSFKGIGKDIKPVSSILQENTNSAVNEIQKGKEIINNKK